MGFYGIATRGKMDLGRVTPHCAHFPFPLAPFFCWLLGFSFIYFPLLPVLSRGGNSNDLHLSSSLLHAPMDLLGVFRLLRSKPNAHEFSDYIEAARWRYHLTTTALHCRVTGSRACPLTTDLIMRVDVRTTTTRVCFLPRCLPKRRASLSHLPSTTP